MQNTKYLSVIILFKDLNFLARNISMLNCDTIEMFDSFAFTVF